MKGLEPLLEVLETSFQPLNTCVIVEKDGPYNYRDESSSSEFQSAAYTTYATFPFIHLLFRSLSF